MVLGCPECIVGRAESVSRPSSNAKRYRCSECGHRFDPDRAVERDAMREGGPTIGLARVLYERDAPES